MMPFASGPFAWRTQTFELVRYSDGRGRVYHLPSERIALEGVHLLPSGVHLLALLDQWLSDPQRRPIDYRADDDRVSSGVPRGGRL